MEDWLTARTLLHIFVAWWRQRNPPALCLIPIESRGRWGYCDRSLNHPGAHRFHHDDDDVRLRAWRFRHSWRARLLQLVATARERIDAIRHPDVVKLAPEWKNLRINGRRVCGHVSLQYVKLTHKLLTHPPTSSGAIMSYCLREPKHDGAHEYTQMIFASEDQQLRERVALLRATKRPILVRLFSRRSKKSDGRSASRIALRSEFDT